MSDPPDRGQRGIAAKVFVRALTVQAEIGVHAHERGRRQPLIVDIEIDVDAATPGWRTIRETVNYDHIVDHARRLADSGHILLVETFAWRLACACMGEARAVRARVRVEKPEALASVGAMAGVEIRSPGTTFRRTK